MSLKHGLLGLLNYGAMTGYELSEAFRSSLSFFWQAKTSQIYRELNTMQDNGWLTSEQVIQTDKPNKRVYTITNAGKSELQNWLQHPQKDIADAMHVRSAFLMRLFFAGQVGNAATIAMLKEFLQKCLESIERLSQIPDNVAHYQSQVIDPDAAKYWMLTAMFGETYYKSEAEFAQKAIAILEGDQNERSSDKCLP